MPPRRDQGVPSLAEIRTASETLLAPETRSFAGTDRTPPQRFLERQEGQVLFDEPERDAASSRFLHGMIERGATMDEILDRMVERARRAPGEKSLRRLRAVMHEISRRRGGSRAVARVMTPDLVREFSAKEE